MPHHSYHRISCPCSRPHNKTYSKGINYTLDECDRLLGFISTDTQDAKLAFFCVDCKSVIEVTVNQGIVEMTQCVDRITTVNDTVVIYE